MKALIIDNDKSIIEGFRLMVEQQVPEITQLKEATTIESGIQLIKDYSPDVLFLDVELDEGTGMDLLSKLSAINFQVIFITAYNKYAVDAFKFSAIDFILKPIGLFELKQSIAKVQKRIEEKKITDQLLVLQQCLSNISNQDKKIVLRDSENIHFVKIADIIRCESDGPYTKFVLSTQKDILISVSLKEYEEMLSPYNFSRVHHSHIINLNKILRYNKKDGGFLVMENNDEVPVSKRKKEELVHIIDKLQQ